MNTVENNRLIAEFMGSQYRNDPYKDKEGVFHDFWHWTKPDCDYPKSIGIGELSTAWSIENFHFHDSWDWLMLVVGKIETSDNVIQFAIRNGSVDLQWWDNDSFKSVSFVDLPKISMVYNAAVEFIKWYNDNISK